MKANYKYIYGPVYSWRLGMSLGIDPLSNRHKICNMDCIYCQLGKTVYFSNERKVYVPTSKIISEIKNLPKMQIDYFTFSGRGEPTLAKNLGDMIRKVRKLSDAKIAVITSSILMDQKDVQEDLMLCDFVLAKLDACNQHTLKKVDKTMRGVEFKSIVQGITTFRKHYKGKLALQIMFMDENKKYAELIADCARGINADEVQINTPLRPSAVGPLGENDLNKIKSYFKGMPAVTVYERERRTSYPFDERATIKRHGNFKVSLSAKK